MQKTQNSRSGNSQNKFLGAHLHYPLHRQLFLEVPPLNNSKPRYFLYCKGGRVGLREIQAEEN